jgi:hypothetical protein
LLKNAWQFNFNVVWYVYNILIDNFYLN